MAGSRLSRSSARGAAPAERRDYLDRKRVYIFPTRTGLVMFVLIGLILLGATNYDNALAFVLCFLLLSMMFSAMLRTWRNLAGLSLEAADATAVFAGGEAAFPITLTAGRGRTHFALCLRHLRPRGRFWWWRPGADAVADIEAVDDAAGVATLAVPAIRRGWLALGRVEIASVYPLGMLRTWAYFRPSARALVYPAPVGELPLPLPVLITTTDGGMAGPGNDDFAGLRHYQPGDALRGIHWKASARSDDLLVKTLSGGAAAERWLRWQDTASLATLEARLSQLTAWALASARAGEAFGLELPQVQVPLGQGVAHLDAVLRELALMPT